MSPVIGIVGASGFIGFRAAESLHLNGLAQIRPIVRSANRLAALSRFDLDGRLADGADTASLHRAFEGCEVIIHAIAGDPETIVGTVEPVYRAAELAGVRRLVYLSTASVHGQAPAAGTDETSPLNNRQPLAYNNAKARAEAKLTALRRNGAVETVILRPGIVIGPRSFWITRFVADLLAGTAWLGNRGTGVCNSIHVDNLVHALHLAATVPGIDGEIFLVGDAETLTWADVYRPIAAAFGHDIETLPEAHLEDSQQGFQGRHWLQSAKFSGLVSWVPKRLRRAAYVALFPPAPSLAQSPWLEPPVNTPRLPVATLEMTLLYGCSYKLPHAKAQRLLGYTPPVSFAEGSRRTLGWLEFAGYRLKPSIGSGTGVAGKGAARCTVADTGTA